MNVGLDTVGITKYQKFQKVSLHFKLYYTSSFSSGSAGLFGGDLGLSLWDEANECWLDSLWASRKRRRHSSPVGNPNSTNDRWVSTFTHDSVKLIWLVL